jgi:type IV secretory pathway VirB10-like protein
VHELLQGLLLALHVLLLLGVVVIGLLVTLDPMRDSYQRFWPVGFVITGLVFFLALRVWPFSPSEDKIAPTVARVTATATPTRTAESTRTPKPVVRATPSPSPVPKVPAKKPKPKKVQAKKKAAVEHKHHPPNHKAKSPRKRTPPRAPAAAPRPRLPVVRAVVPRACLPPTATTEETV